MLHVWTNYGRLLAATILVAIILAFDGLLIRPMAFVLGASQPGIAQWMQGLLALLLTLLAIRVTQRELINGVLARRSGNPVPQLVGDVAGAGLFFIGMCVILAAVFKRDITGFLAAGGASIMVLGLALRDMVLAAFTGVVLNVEKPFKPGDMVRIADKFQGRVERITWRATVLHTNADESVIVPNLMLANAIIVNLDSPDTRTRRTLEVVIDYDTSVESAERVLYAAALAAGITTMTAQPVISARRMERDGVVYEIAFTISNFADFKRAEHEMIKSVLKCMRDARITVSFPKTEVIRSDARAAIANRSLDSFFLVQQCRLFRSLPHEICYKIAEVLVEHSLQKGDVIVRAGEARHSMFIVGEGLARRLTANRDGSATIEERFIATESFGRRALFCLDLQAATVTAETNVLVYELKRDALATLFAEQPELKATMARALAQISWQPDGQSSEIPDAAALQRQVALYEGQIEASYGQKSDRIGTDTQPISRIRAAQA
jgi:small-conductance mechanosensitive channel/CRP-like cAMP-binding protein